MKKVFMSVGFMLVSSLVFAGKPDKNPPDQDFGQQLPTTSSVKKFRGFRLGFDRGQLSLNVLLDVNGYTSYEDFSEDGSDVSVFSFGIGSGRADHVGTPGAGTRGFKPGYNIGKFALITSGTSTIDFPTPSDVQFNLRNIVELGDLIPGFENVVGTVTVIGTKKAVTVDATANGSGQANNWDLIDSKKLKVGKVVKIIVENNATGVTNIDDLYFYAKKASFSIPLFGCRF